MNFRELEIFQNLRAFFPGLLLFFSNQNHTITQDFYKLRSPTYANLQCKEKLQWRKTTMENRMHGLIEDA